MTSTAAATASPAGSPSRRQRILETVLDLLLETPAEHIQVKDVAQRSEVALSTLYSEFPSKVQMLAAALEHWNAMRLERFSAVGNSSAESLQSRALGFFRNQLRAYQARPHYARLEVELHTMVDEAVVSSLDDRAAANRAVFFHTVPELAPEEARVASLVVGSTQFNSMALWTTGRISFAQAMRNVEDAVRLSVQ